MGKRGHCQSPKQCEQRWESGKEEASSGHGAALCVIRANAVCWEIVNDNMYPEYVGIYVSLEQHSIFVIVKGQKKHL